MIAVEHPVLLSDELRAAIRQQIGLGLYDPPSIASALRRLHGHAWVDARVAALAEERDLLGREIRTQLGQGRRQADHESGARQRLRARRAQQTHDSEREAAARRGENESAALDARLTDAIAEYRRLVIADFLTDMLVPQAVPGGGWKRRADLTIADCRAIAEQYEKRAVTETGMAFAFAHFADAMDDQGVTKLGDLDPSRLTERIPT